MPFSVKQDLKLIRTVKENPILYDHNDFLYMDFNAREVVWQKIGDALKCPAAECKARWINIRDINRRIMRKRLKHPEQKGTPYKYSSELHFMKPFYKDVMIQNATFLESCENNDSNCDTTADVYSSGDSNSDEPINKLKVAGSSKRKKSQARAVKKESPSTSVGINNPTGELDASDEVDAFLFMPINKLKGLESSKRKKRQVRGEELDTPSTSAGINDSTNATGEVDSSDQVDAFLLSIGATLKTFSPYRLNLAKSQIFAVVQEHDLQQIKLEQSSTGHLESNI